MPMPDLRRLLPVAVAFAVAGCCCGPVDASSRPAGVYVLTSVAGTPLPAPANPPGTAPVTAVADTLVLRADSTGSEHFVGRTGGPGTASDVSRMTELSWHRTAGEVQITYVCPPNADCVAGPHLKAAETSDTSLVVSYSIATRTPLQYRRVGP